MLRPGIREYFRLRARAPERVAADVEEEIALHIELRARELEAAGMSPEESRAEAERRFGAMTRARLKLQRSAQDRERGMSVREWLEGWRQDFGYSARALRRQPLLALVIVLTLALGIGANATMFGIIDRLLLRGPEHVHAPEQLRRLYITQRGWDDVVSTMSWAGYVQYTMVRDRTDLFQGAATYSLRGGLLGSGADAREVMIGWASADLFPVLGVQPALGRFFTAAEDEIQPQRVAVIDYGTWQSDYGGAREVLGRTIALGEEKYTIIGVMPRGFTGPELGRVHAWVPIGTVDPPHPEWRTTLNARWLDVIVRLAPGATWERATAEVTRSYRASAPPDREREREAVLDLRPLDHGKDGQQPPELPVSRWLAGVSLIVLLVACANVTNLLLARALRRRREIAVRLALGISRARLTRLLLSESLLLALAGGLLALALAYWGGQALRVVLLPDVQWGAPVDGRVLLFSFVAALTTGVVIGLAPVLQSRTRDLTETLKATSLRTASGGGGARATLTVLQAAFAVVLLVGAALFARSLWNAQRVDLGIDAGQVLDVWPMHVEADIPWESAAAWDAERERQRQQLRVIAERLRAHPGIAGAVLVLGTPLRGTLAVDLRVPGRDSLPDLPGGGPFITAASGGYFETVGTSILRGRGILASDGEGSEPVVVVGQTMAAALWPGEDPLTKCLYVGDPDAPCFRVVGMAEDTKRDGLRDLPSMRYYVPLGQETQMSGTSLVVRPRGNAAAFVPELRRTLHELDPAALFFHITPLQETIDPQLRPWRLGATMFLVFGAVALLIAAIGLYSVIAYGVAQRRTELGVRIALGARGAAIVRMVLSQGMALVAAGIALGAGLSWAAGAAVESLLFEQSAHDPRVYAMVAGTLLFVAALAIVLPARRAGRTSPMDALRTE